MLTRIRGREERSSYCKGDSETQLVSRLCPLDLKHHLTGSRRINKSPTTVEEKEYLKLMLTEPPVKKIDLHFPLGLEVTARNLKGVTIKDALDAIYKQFKKKVCTHRSPLNLMPWPSAESLM